MPHGCHEHTIRAAVQYCNIADLDSSTMTKVFSDVIPFKPIWLKSKNHGKSLLTHLGYYSTRPTIAAAFYHYYSTIQLAE